MDPHFALPSPGGGGGATKTGDGAATPKPGTRVTILHMSDTHGFHRQIPMSDIPKGIDLLLHTGDFSNGNQKEFRDFDTWCGEVKKQRPKMRIVGILGNHEFYGDMWKHNSHLMTNYQRMKKMMVNIELLFHEEIVFKGLRIFGSPWEATQGGGGNPDSASVDYFGRFIKPGTHVLMTHGPAEGIFDRVDGGASGWGASRKLKHAIVAKGVKAHLFGHMHEQRGQWLRNKFAAFSSSEPAYVGGCEYRYRYGNGAGQWRINDKHCRPPLPTYPCDLVSCTAMANHQLWKGSPYTPLPGTPRVIIATYMGPARGWEFDAKALPPSAKCFKCP